MNIKKSLYSRKGITTLASIMAVLIIGSGIVASKKDIFADTTQSPELNATVLLAGGTNKEIFRVQSDAPVSYFYFWWNCPALPEDVTEAQLIARCGQPYVPASVTPASGNLAVGVKPTLHGQQASYKKTLPAQVTNGKFVVFAKGTTGTTYRKTITYTSGVKNLAVYSSGWHASAANLVSTGTRFLIMNLTDNDGDLPLRRFSVWYNCTSNNLTADKDTLAEIKTICGTPDVVGMQYSDRLLTDHLFSVFTPSTLVAAVDQQSCSGNYCQWWDGEPVKLVAKQAYTPLNLTPTPTRTQTQTGTPVTPGPLTVSLANSIQDATKPQSVTLTANVTDANTAYAPTNYTFWWNCTANVAANSNYEAIKTACGEPQNTADSTDPVKTRIGRKFDSVWVTGSDGKLLKNSLATTMANYPVTGPVTAIVLVERRTAAVTQKVNFTVAGTSLVSTTPGPSNTATQGPLTVSLANSIQDATKPQSVTLTANVTDANTAYAPTNYTFWWNCTANVAANSSYETIKTACGEPQNTADSTDPVKTRIGRKFDSVWVTGSDGKLLKNSLATTMANYPVTGPVTAIVLVERRTSAVTQKVNFTVAGTSLVSTTPGSSNTVTPGPLTVSLANSIQDATNPQSVTLTANVTDANTAYAPTNYTFWWNCTANVAANSSYETIKTACGEPQNTADSTDPVKTRIGRKFDSVWVTGSDGKLLKNSLATTMANYPVTGPVTAIVLVERRTAVVTQKVNFTVAGTSLVSTTPGSSTTPGFSSTPGSSNTVTPGPLTVSLANSIQDATNPQSVTLTANVTDPNTVYASTNYTFWWNCTANVAANSSYETIKTACGEPQNTADSTDPVKTRIGRKFDSVWVTGSDGKLLKNSLATTMVHYPTTGLVTAIVLVERRTSAVTQKVNFTVEPTAGQSVTPAPGTITKAIVHGYNVFGSSAEVSLGDLASKGFAAIWGFNTPEKPSTDARYTAVWNRYPTDNLPFKVKAGHGYYLYNQDAAKTIVLNALPGNPSLRTVRPGWNLLWSEKEQSLSTMKGVLYGSSTAKCVVSSVTLGDLVDQGIAYSQVYVIQQQNVSTSSKLDPECQIFRLVGPTAVSGQNCKVNRENNTISGLGVLTSIPADKGVWFYVYPSRVIDERTNTLTTGSKC